MQLSWAPSTGSRFTESQQWKDVPTAESDQSTVSLQSIFGTQPLGMELTLILVNAYITYCKCLCVTGMC